MTKETEVEWCLRQAKKLKKQPMSEWNKKWFHDLVDDAAALLVAAGYEEIGLLLRRKNDDQFPSY